MFLYAHINFQTGLYAGYARTKRTSDVDLLYGLRERGPKAQNQGTGLWSLGVSYNIAEFELGLNGFLGTSFFKEEYFKNRFSTGAEAEILYRINKFAFGLLGGFEMKRIKSHRYECYYETQTDIISNNELATKWFPCGFIGLKVSYTLTNNWNIGVKYHCISSKEKALNETLQTEKGSITLPDTGRCGPRRKTLVTGHTNFLEHRILAGIEFKIRTMQ